MALAGVTSAAERADNLWTMTFSSETDPKYSVTGSYTPTNMWDLVVSDGNDYASTDGSTKRIHSRWEKGSGLNWGENFEVEIVFTLPENFAKNDNTPYIIAFSGSGGNTLTSSVPYLAITLSGESQYLSLLGSVTPTNASTTTVTTGQENTAVIRLFEGVVSLTLNDKLVQTGTFNASNATGSISNVLLGGGAGNGNHRIAENIHSVSAYKVIPEPATATLSLLALAGLAARRRRK